MKNPNTTSNQITTAIETYRESDRVYQSHSRLTRFATNHLRQSQSDWVAVIDLIRDAGLGVIAEAGKTHKEVWTAIHQIRNESIMRC